MHTTARINFSVHDQHPAGIFFRFPHVPHVCCLFTTKAQGSLSFDSCQHPEDHMAVCGARQQLAQQLGGIPLAELRQVHGVKLHHASTPTGWTKASDIEADGQVTSLSTMALAIKTADCQPILLTHRKGDFVAGLHVGWRGSAADFIGQAIAQIAEMYAVQPKDMLAVRGPSLGPTNAEFIHFFQEWPQHFLPWYDNTHKTVDLWALTRHQLEQAGIPREQIYSLDACTMQLTRTFFSYRRGDAGRQMGLIWKETTAP